MPDHDDLISDPAIIERACRTLGLTPTSAAQTEPQMLEVFFHVPGRGRDLLRTVVPKSSTAES